MATLEAQLLKSRTRNVLYTVSNKFSAGYAAVVEERNRLEDPPKTGWSIGSLDLSVPHRQSAALFEAIVAAAKGVQCASTIRAEDVLTRKNGVLPLTLKTGDEFGPALYALVRNAARKVQLQTYLYYEKSEAAKWLHKALDELQQKQRARKADGLDVTPIEVEICLDDSRGLARQDRPGDGGLLKYQETSEGRKVIPRRNEVSNYGIGYPARLDPAMVKVTVKGLKHYGRGSLHSKTVVVDDKYALVSTNNFKGSHHKISMNGAVRFDAGIVISGDASKAIRDDFEAVSKKAKTKLGSNASEAAIEENDEESYSLSREYYPAVHRGEIRPLDWKGYDIESEREHANQIVADVEKFIELDPSENDLEVAIISKPLR